MGRYIEAEEGARLGSSSWRRIDDNALPPRGKICGSYVNSALVKSEAIIHGYDEALVFNEDGHVSEGSAENVFIIRKGVLITPPVTDNILEGITRLSVMELAQNELGIEVVERPIDRTEVYTADEAFFTGTAAQVTAIVEVDHRTIGSGKLGPITSKLRNLYLDVVHGKVPKYRHWCTPVYPK
jgi:branched-chain amino acid aminotransferase